MENGKEQVMSWRIADPRHLVGALRVALTQGGQFLVSRLAPNGPILRERNVSYMHKASWGMYAAGVDHDTLARMLDWVQREALQPNGDFYFPEEGPEYKDMQRVYRATTFGKVAAWIGHPVVRQARVLERILQYQHKPSGGAFAYIGDDPKRVEPPPVIGSLNTTFFGHLMIALDMRGEALAAGDWVRRWIEANREPLQRGMLLTQMTPDGRLVSEIRPGERISKVLDNKQPKQEFWHVGTAMAYLAVLYDTMRSRWSYTAEQARPYLDAALVLLDFESTMPLDTYLWPSKCKVGWGAGELLRVLVQYQLAGNGDRHPLTVPVPVSAEETTVETAYRVAERVAMFTFLDNQLPHGGWPAMHYPLSQSAPELDFSYRPLKGVVWVPAERIAGSQTIWLPGEEITGEFLGEMKSIEQGAMAMLRRGA
jgi:hypothetical protein